MRVIPIIARMSERFIYDEVVFKGRILEVRKVGLKMHDGQVVQREFIRYRGAAVILPVLGDGSIVLIKNYRFAVDEHLYELPAGMLEDAEDPALCAARELIEETGYSAGRLEKLGQFYSSPGSTDEIMHSYLATELTDGDQDLEIYEQITVEVVSDAQARQMVLDGRIHDAKSISTLSLYWLGLDTFKQ